jgi:nucleotide sugar dehydrogenase
LITSIRKIYIEQIQDGFIVLLKNKKELSGLISVIGLGKMGLPFAVQCASNGHKVFGCDTNQNVVSMVNSGKAPFKGEPDLEEFLANAVAKRNLEATTDSVEAISKSKFVVVLVPVYVDQYGVPDFGVIDSVTDSIGKSITPGTLVSYETTLPIGTTRNRFAERISELSGLSAGEDFFVAFSPERVSSGSVFSDFRHYPKLVGGINQASSKAAKDFYEKVLAFDPRPDLSRPNGVWDLGTSEAAEFAKLAETTYRDVNIGLANQFAIHAETVGVDIYKVIEACNSQPFSHIHQPGIAVGGHCIPVYPHFYLQGDPDATVVVSSRKANAMMPSHVVQRVKKELGSLTGKTIAVLGLAYRGGVKEHAFSGALSLVENLRKEGALPKIHDPLYSDEEISALGFESYHLGEECEAAILHTNHSQYSQLTTNDIPGARFFVDGRNFSNPEIRKTIKTYVIGVGN